MDSMECPDEFKFFKLTHSFSEWCKVAVTLIVSRLSDCVQWFQQSIMILISVTEVRFRTDPEPEPTVQFSPVLVHGLGISKN